MQQSKSGAAAASVQQSEQIPGDAVTGPDVIAVDVEDEE